MAATHQAVAAPEDSQRVENQEWSSTRFSPLGLIMIQIEVPEFPSVKDKIVVLAWALACRSKGVKFEVTREPSRVTPFLRMRGSGFVYGLQPVLEMIEERFGDPALMPVDIQERWATRVRLLSMINAIHSDDVYEKWPRRLSMASVPGALFEHRARPGALFISGNSFTLADCVAVAMLTVGSTPETREQVAWCKEYFDRLSAVPAVMQAVALCGLDV